MKNTYKNIKYIALFAFVATLLSCNKNNVIKGNSNIIPKPEFVEKTGEGHFSINDKTKLFVSKSKDSYLVKDYISNMLSKSLSINLKTTDDKDENNSIVLLLDPSQNSNDLNFYDLDESYELESSKNRILIKAKTTRGLFYGVQTLRSILPNESESKNSSKKVSFGVPFLRVIDKPAFKYRGIHLDVGRHLFDLEFIKKYIDYIAMHKMNTFHWHLTEDQGWRIEIDKYPKLTEVGGFRKETLKGHYTDKKGYDGKPYGGFYTKKQIKEVLDYAKRNFVNVIPEIEFPGHSLAALAAYPELSCTGEKMEVGKKWGVFDDIHCTKEVNFKFMEDVLTEVVDLFPSKFIHIGGDEAPKKRWKKCKHCQRKIKKLGLKDEHELQSYFIKRIQKFLSSKGRILIGWDEILEGGLANNAVVMSWRGIKGGLEAAKKGHFVIMSPTTYCYFDYYQTQEDKDNKSPLAIGGLLTLEKVYSYNPYNKFEDRDKQYILGVQANVWTEYMKTSKKVEYMLFPRIAAICEVAWTNNENKDWKDFLSRMKDQYKRYEYMNINYKKPKSVEK